MTAADDRTRSTHVRKFIRSIAIPVGLAVVTIVTGTIGYLLYLPTTPPFADAPTLWVISEGFFRSFRFLVLSLGAVTTEDPVVFFLLSISRASGILFAFSAAVAGLGLLFAKQLRPLRIEAWSQLGRLPGVTNHGHVVVCGLSDDGYSLATEALEAGRNVVAVETERNDRTAELEVMGAIVLEGDASYDGVLGRRARLARAADVFVTTDEDTTNSAIVETVAQLADRDGWGQVLDVTARIDDSRLRRTLHEQVTATDGVDLRTYSVPEATARELLAEHPVDEFTDRNASVHVWLIGWTTLSKALVDQLLHRMHYLDGVERKVTVLTDRPNEVEREMSALSPGIDPDWWPDEAMRKFVTRLFPDIEIQRLPATDMALLSHTFSPYDDLEDADTLTVIADDSDVRSLRSLVSVLTPKLEDVAARHDVDAQLLYRSSDDALDPVVTSEMRTATYTAFGDGCSASAVRGDSRDRIARRLALVYHVLYTDEPASSFDAIDSDSMATGESVDAVFSWLEALSEAERDRYATTVWRDLPEYQRESNRHAADHAAVKYRMARILGGSDGAYSHQTVQEIAASEHRRWCAEKILDGWEPLPESEAERWNRDETVLRKQRYHPSIRPVESLRSEMDGEWQKDVSLVEAVLTHPETMCYRSDLFE